MQKPLIVLTFIALMVLGVACSTSPSSATPAPGAVGTPSPDQRQLSGLTQLLIGTFKLEDTALAVTSEQAQTLLPLWQAVQSLSASGTAATQEMSALEQQIKATFTAEQWAQIESLQLGPGEFQTLAEELGLSWGNGNGGGTNAEGTPFPRGGDGGAGFGPPPDGGFAGGGGPGGGGALTADQQATLEARRANRPALQVPTQFVEALIKRLETRVAEKP